MDNPRRSNTSGDSRRPPARWSDETLLALVRGADEAELLHEEAERPIPSLRLAGGTTVGARGSFDRAWSWRWFAAAAALVAVGVMLYSPGGTTAPQQITHNSRPPNATSVETPVLPASSLAHVATSRPTEVVVPVRQPTRPGDATVILTISQDADGRCRCVTSVTHQLLAGQNVGDLATSELLGVGLQRLCEATPERVLVLGMSGPRELLPQNKAEAERFASCLDHGPGHCETDATCFASSALACVSPSVNIVAETVALRK